jgi:hypothetical protein
MVVLFKNGRQYYGFDKSCPKCAVSIFLITGFLPATTLFWEKHFPDNIPEFAPHEHIFKSTQR